MDENSACSSSNDSASVASTTHTTGSDSAACESSKEAKVASIAKRALLAFLLIATVLLGWLTNQDLANEGRKDFEAKFNMFAVQISQVAQEVAETTLLSSAAMATPLTSHALDSRALWPFVSMPHFEIQGIMANSIASSSLSIFSPLVSHSTKGGWEKYSVKQQGWIEEGINHRITLKKDTIVSNSKNDQIPKEIFRFEDNFQTPVPENSEGPYLPVWQMAPVPLNTSIVNYNLLSHPVFSRLYEGAMHTGRPVFSEAFDLDFLQVGPDRSKAAQPRSVLLQPIYQDFKTPHNGNDIVGFITSILPWDNYFTGILSENTEGILVAVTDTCNYSAFTYLIHGQEANYLGKGDLHDSKYDNMVVKSGFLPSDGVNASEMSGCDFVLNIYPTSDLEDFYKSAAPVWFTTGIVLALFFTAMIVMIYDCWVQRRQDKVMTRMKQNSSLISSLFPSNVRARIMDDADQQLDAKDNKSRFGAAAAKNQLQDFLNDGGNIGGAGVFGSKPIADFFPHTTVMFADIVGFTAWSSVREPSQVFQLLETLYFAFDGIAKRRKVFKVETVGDCYVAVTGLPDLRRDHAVVMARFARDCLTTMNDKSRKLELTLGPDTGDLSLRIGLNSGPVTAGVLRGENSRFQLFGDTMNTAARMESTGERGKIHMSQDTADLLIAAEKDHWVLPRKEKVFAKGKGELQTYWLHLNANAAPSRRSIGDYSSTGNVSVISESCEAAIAKAQIISDPAVPTESIKQERAPKPLLTDKIERLVSWNSDVMLRILKQIVARRNASSESKSAQSGSPLQIEMEDGKTPLDEVKELIALPKFDAKAMANQESPNLIKLDPNVTAQLRDYITIIATMYRDIPFHNFEHASHVTMSVVKLLSRIVAPDVVCEEGSIKEMEQTLHDHTYGITSDPLTQFSVVFSALIHDVDHTGVTNAQLVKEEAKISAVYKAKSVAEQNSVDIAWELLMDDSFNELRDVIYTDQSEMKRFRQLIVNTVMATDIVDKDLKDLRNSRWNKAFHSKEEIVKNSRDDVNRKATIVIEHLIQASDVAHTMQHWHIYRKWNERFFQEMLNAYETGRGGEKDPSEFWYKGEMGFFDFYIIPLAEKLKECGVFGVSSHEYLNYAMANRKEWELKGEEVVAEMVAKYKEKGFDYSQDQCKLGEEKVPAINGKIVD